VLFAITSIREAARDFTTELGDNTPNGSSPFPEKKKSHSQSASPSAMIILIPLIESRGIAISLDRTHIGAQQQQAGAKPNEVD
jgi:hypothetical protein